jgi:hypothetical protein
VCVRKEGVGNDEDHLARVGGPDGQTQVLGEEGWDI